MTSIAAKQAFLTQEHLISFCIRENSYFKREMAEHASTAFNTQALTLKKCLTEQHTLLERDAPDMNPSCRAKAHGTMTD
jgi:hypothetical protein